MLGFPKKMGIPKRKVEESCVLFQVTKTFFGTKRVRLSLGIPRKINSLHLKATRILIWPSVGSCRSRSERKSCF